MKKLIFLLLLFFAACSQAVTKRALVIGIGDYPEISGWAKINGDKDVPVVKNMLIANGFAEKNIDALINEQATHAGISNAIAHLTSKAQKGDVVYIHFSGHGQQVVDVDGDEDDGKDEAWIPYDARAVYQENVYEGENHILDDELFAWFSKIKEKIGKEGNLVVVADACHSGDGSRGDEDGEEECIRGSFISDLADASLIFLKKIVEKKDNVSSSTPIKGEIDWIFISACKSYQSNQEYKKAGSLTAALASLKDRLTSLSYDDLRRELAKWMGSHLPRTQTPQMDKPNQVERKTLF